MPAEKNTLLRIIVPVVIALLGVVVMVAGYLNSSRQPGTKSAQQQPQTAAESGAAAPAVDESQSADSSDASVAAKPESSDPSASAPTPPAPAGSAPQGDTISAGPPVVDAAAKGVLRARVQPKPERPPQPLGSLTQGGDSTAQVSFTLLGAGVEAITMTDHFETVAKQANYEVQQRVTIPLGNGAEEYLTSLAARAVIIDGQLVDLFGSIDQPVWRETSVGWFEAMIVDEKDQPVVRLSKRYVQSPGSFVVDILQSAENLTDQELRVEWVQYGPVELHEDISGYGIDMRRVRLGYLLNQKLDPSGQYVEADDELEGRASYVDRVIKKQDGLVWPRPDAHEGAGGLVWIAQTSRYFTFAVFPRADTQQAAANAKDPAASPMDKSFALADEVFAIVRGNPADPSTLKLLLQLTSRALTLPAKGTLDLSFASYAGPLGRRQLATRADPVFGALGLNDLVIYNVGGPCAWCTWQWLAKGLLAFLTFLHDYVVFDWALAIMVLVVCVRTALHPITRRSQINMARFSKQMQAMAPKQQKLREKFKDDPKRMQEEMIKLMREEKVNYANALGCIPMFLQSPIWFALYAMLYFSFDLRHAPAFFGGFQAISGGRWDFLADLSVADHFIYFGRSVAKIPLLGHITGINVLPIVLGVVFYLQQKYLTPQTTAAMSPEQEMQMKMMRFMTVFMFPVFMYNAPSGLAIYFITNSTLGILESRWIRAHIDQLDKNPPAEKGPGILGRKKVDNTAAKHAGKKRG